MYFYHPSENLCHLSYHKQTFLLVLFFFFSCFMMFKRKLCILKPQKFGGHMALWAYLHSFPLLLLLLLQIVSCTNGKTTIVWLACVMSTFVTRVNHSLPLSMHRCRQIGSFVFRSSYECFLRDWLIRNSRWDSSKVNKSVCLVDFAGFQSTVFSSYDPVQHLRVTKELHISFSLWASVLCLCCLHKHSPLSAAHKTSVCICNVFPDTHLCLRLKQQKCKLLEM